jgi:hypothetical protein
MGYTGFHMMASPAISGVEGAGCPKGVFRGYASEGTARKWPLYFLSVYVLQRFKNVFG